MLIADAVSAPTGLSITTPQHSGPLPAAGPPSSSAGNFLTDGIHSRCEVLGNSQPHPHPKTLELQWSLAAFLYLSRFSTALLVFPGITSPTCSGT